MRRAIVLAVVMLAACGGPDADACGGQCHALTDGAGRAMVCTTCASLGMRGSSACTSPDLKGPILAGSVGIVCG